MEIIFIFLNLILSLIAIPMLMKMLSNNNIVAKNYRGELIPICLGMVFILVELISVFLYYVFDKDLNILLYLIGLVTMGFIGILDDLAGDIEVKGLKGHIKSFLKGELTTGFIKAGVGFFIAFMMSIFISEGSLNILINTFLIALSINALNLFDLRPGRALKVFNFLGLIFIILNRGKDSFILLSMMVISLVYLPYDIKARTMMGDTGSNVLGFTLGYYCSLTQAIEIRIVYLCILVVLHLIAEKYSISKLIEGNKFLKYIDQLGR